MAPASVAEDGAANLVYTFTRTNTTGETPALTVNFTIGGTATEGTDYAAVSRTVNFAAGSSTAAISVDPTADSDVEADETVTLTVNSGSNYTVGSPASASGTIGNDDRSSVSVAVAPASVDEDGAANLVYTFTRTNTTAETPALTVNFTIGGTATEGTDYAAVGRTVNFAAGSSTAAVSVDPTADSDVEADETVILTVSSGSSYTVGSPASASGTIGNDDRSSVSVAVAPASVDEDGAANLVYTFTRTNTTAETPALTVNFTIGGTATEGTDYAAVSRTVNFAAGSSTAAVSVDPTADSDVEADETVVLTVSSGGDYTVGSPASASGTIGNDDRSSVSVAVAPASVAEDGAANLVYTFTRTNTTAETPALTVNFTVGGTATEGTDYAAVSRTVNFAAGSNTATVSVDPTADSDVEADQTVVLTVSSGSNYTVGSPASADGTIGNDDRSSVSVAVASASVAEDGAANLVYTLTRTNTTAETPALTVNFTIGGTATEGTDYAAVGRTVNFAAGSSTATVSVDPTADSDVEADQTVVLTVSSGSDYTVGSPASASGTIGNDDRSSVSVAVAPPSVAEDGTANLVYTLTRTNTTAETPALTVNFTVGGTATLTSDYTQTGATTFTATSGTVVFSAGSTTATVTVDPVADQVVESDNTVVLTLVAGTGYTVSGSEATGTIANDDQAVLAIAASKQAAEDATAGEFRITTSKRIEDPLIVTVAVTGTATAGTDYATIGTTFTFPANSDSFTIPVTVTADNVVESAETVTVTLTGTSLADATIDSANNAAIVTITDNDATTVSITCQRCQRRRTRQRRAVHGDAWRMTKSRRRAASS